MEGFTLSMALMDCLPVLFFSISVGVLGARFGSALFFAGAALVILAGALKVSWKFVLALAHRDVPVLSRQMRYLMPAGFVLMLCALVLQRDRWSPAAVLSAALSLPALVFFLLGIAGIVCMTWFAGHADRKDAKANWKEQGVNSLAQLCFLIGILMS